MDLGAPEVQLGPLDPEKTYMYKGNNKFKKTYGSSDRSLDPLVPLHALVALVTLRDVTR